MRKAMTYYRIWKYLKDHGLTSGQAHYARNMIRELVKTPPETRKCSDDACSGEGYCALHGICHYEY
jgi:hypothetical protein